MNIFFSSIALTIYFVIYGVVHSWLASISVKNWMRQTFGSTADRWYRLAYNIFAVITLLPLLPMLILLPSRTLYVVPLPWRWLMVTGQLLAILAAAISLLQTGALHFMGLSQLVDEDQDRNDKLNLGGFYAWVRHPLYTFSIVFLWLTPVMTTSTLTLFILFTLYFYVGSIYEERRLVAEFGAAYENYRRQVPRLMPLPGRRYQTNGS